MIGGIRSWVGNWWVKEGGRAINGIWRVGDW